MFALKPVGALAALSILALAGAQTPAAAPTSAPAQATTFTIKRVPVKGAEFITFLNAQISIQGMDVTFTTKNHYKVGDVAADGSYTISSTQTDGHVSFNGSEQDIPESPEVISTFLPGGEIKEIKSENVGEAQWRLAHLMMVHSPDAPVKQDDSWSYKMAADKDKGGVGVSIDYKLLGTEKVGTFDTVKISVAAKETEGSDPAKVTGTVWLDVKDFSIVQSTMTWSKVPIMGSPEPVDGTVKVTRIVKS